MNTSSRKRLSKQDSTPLTQLLRASLPRWLIGWLGVATLGSAIQAAQTAPEVPALERLPGAKPHRIVFILADDHRYDALGFQGHPFSRKGRADGSPAATFPQELMRP
jgi:hypothetical protein